MSAITIAGDTSGSITLDAPAVAGSNTLTLPAATGTVIYSNASGNLLFNSGYGSVATAYGCRAWVNFNGTGTVAIRASGNVSSITDNGTGDYTVNFTTAMPDANYTWVGTCDPTSSQSSDTAVKIVFGNSTSNPVAASFRCVTVSSGFAREDFEGVYIAVFR